MQIMIGEKTKIFLIGIAGGIAGVIVIVGIFFGFFFVMNKLHTIEITCLPQEEVEKRDISCKILEVKERGDILKVSEIISPPTDEKEFKRIKDRKTDGKFVEVKLKIRNNQEETINLSEVYFIDQEKRKFPCLYGDIMYWLPENEDFRRDFLPDIEKEFVKIFEVPKNAELSKLKVKFFKSSRLFD